MTAINANKPLELTRIGKTGWSYLFNAVAGAVLALAFAPVNGYLLPYLSLVVLLYSLPFAARPRHAFLMGFCFGCGFFTMGISWVYVSLHYFGGGNMWLAAGLTLLLIAYMALFCGLTTYLYRILFAGPIRGLGIVGFASLWVLAEWLRSWLLTGFPWLLLGFSQVNAPLAGFAPIVGAYGVSWLLCFQAGCLVLGVQRGLRTGGGYYYLLALIVLLIGICLQSINWTQAAGHPIRVSLVQGNIPQSVKWESGRAQMIIQRYVSLSTPYWDSDLIVWPESAIPIPLPYAHNITALLQEMALSHNTTLVTGIPQQTAQGEYQNALIALGASQGEYSKRHLVPFGEYLPLGHLLAIFHRWIDIPMAGMRPGPSHPQPLQLAQITFLPLICYEVGYPELFNTDWHHTQALITISDDAWFGHSFAQAQQLQIGQFRALQMGRYLLAGTNNGITAIIDAHGKITHTIPAFSAGVLQGELQPMQGITPWQYLGFRFWVACFAAILLLCCYLDRQLTGNKHT